MIVYKFENETYICDGQKIAFGFLTEEIEFPVSEVVNMMVCFLLHEKLDFIKGQSNREEAKKDQIVQAIDVLLEYYSTPKAVKEAEESFK